MRLITLLVLLLFSNGLAASADSLVVLAPTLPIDAADQIELDRAREMAATGNIQGALELYQNLINHLLPEFNNDDPAVNPSENDLYYSSPLLIKVLLSKADLLEKLANPKDKSGQSLEPALATRELIVDALFHLRQNYKASELSYDNGQAGREEEWAAINLAYKLYEKSNNPSYLLRCFRLVEKSKKTALSNALVHPQTFQLANVAPEELEKLTNSKEQVETLKTKWAKALSKAKTEETEEAKTAKNEYVVARKTYNRKLSEFSKRYPEVFGVRYNESVVTVGEIQNRMQNPDQVLLSYYNTKEYMYGFVITLDGLKAKRISHPDALNKQINRFCLMLKNKEEQKNCKAYDSLALQLYETLIKPFEPLSKEVIIIPDETIGYLPFNALLYTVPSVSCDFGTYPYLLNKYQISLHYSAEEFAKEAYAKDHNLKGNFTALASEEKNYVKKLTRQLKGNEVTAEQSPEKQLVNMMYSVPMVLLANKMEAYSGEERGRSPLMWLGEGRTDINRTKEVAELVVLSDCDVKPSLEPKGDHIPNVARGLFHFGAKSVLTTLWQLPSNSNEELLPVFFNQLKKGKNKTTALQSSNQSYLKKAKTADVAAPSQWAAYTLIGNTNSIAERNWYWLLLGIIPLTGIWYYWRKRRRAKLKKDREVTTTMEY